MLTMQQSSKSVTDKYKKELKSQDFVMLSQENKEYRQLIRVIEQKVTILEKRINQLESNNIKLNNEKDQYKMRCIEYTNKISHYQSIKNQLLQEYQILKQQINNHSIQNHKQERDSHHFLKTIDQLQQANVYLEQHLKKKDLIIEELKNNQSKLERQIVDSKIKIFSQMVDEKPKAKSNTRKQNSMCLSNALSHTQTFKNSNNANSISFSLVSNESQPKRKGSIKSKCNHSILI